MATKTQDTLEAANTFDTFDVNPCSSFGGEWPANLYQECYDMGMISALTYEFGYFLEIVRREQEEGRNLKGLKWSGENIVKSEVEDSALQRSFTPSEIKKIILDNKDILTGREHRSVPFDMEEFIQYTEVMEQRAAMALSCSNSRENIERPLTLEEFDDTFTSKEAVYGITKDDVHKRITVAFRGTDNSLAFANNWGSNLRFFKKRVATPDLMKDKLKRREKIKFHSGFYRLLFKDTLVDKDDEDTTKYDQVLADLKSILEKNEGYKVYVTGHSLGGALATIAAFYFSCDPDLPKPISVINFSSPRVANEAALKAFQIQEKAMQLRIMRVVSAGDTIAVTPAFGYCHVGFQMTLKKWINPKKPIIHYPNLKRGMFFWLKISWRNSYPNSFNFRFDHTDHLRRMTVAKEQVSKLHLNELYSDPELVGFQLDVDLDDYWNKTEKEVDAEEG